MIGAPALVALGALRAGCGLVRVLAPAPIVETVIGIVPSATGVAMPVDGRGAVVAHEAVALIDEAVRDARVVVAGPGLGRGGEAAAIALRCIQQQEAIAVIDADALNALATVSELSAEVRAAAVVTPHPGEFRRLARALHISESVSSDAERREGAAQLAQRLGAIAVLKGAGTVVSDGQRSWVCDTGCAALATAGTGDVLAGVIAGVAAQFVAGVGEPRTSARPMELYDAVRLAVRAHGRAGQMWSQRRGAPFGLMAAEVAELVPMALAEHR